MRTIVNHNAQAWADDYLALSGRCMVHASEIETSGTAHPLHWHIHGQLQSIARLAFDIQACILRANQPTDKEPEMTNTTTMPISELSRQYKLPEMCDDLTSLISLLADETDIAPLNVKLQNAINLLRDATNNISVAEEQMAEYAQQRADQPMIEAISAALVATFGHETNAGPARGMLQDIAASGEVILRAIRDAGYVISPEPPF